MQSVSGCRPSRGDTAAVHGVFRNPQQWITHLTVSTLVDVVGVATTGATACGLKPPLATARPPVGEEAQPLPPQRGGGANTFTREVGGDLATTLFLFLCFFHSGYGLPHGEQSGRLASPCWASWSQRNRPLVWRTSYF